MRSNLRAAAAVLAHTPRRLFAEARATRDNTFKLRLAERTLASVLAQAQAQTQAKTRS